MSRLLAISKLFCFSWATTLTERSKVRIRVLMYFIFLLFVRVCLCRDSRRLLTDVSSLRDWVIAASAPRVAREDALEGEPSALEEAVFFDGLDAVVGASRHIAATFSDPRRKRHLIKPNQENQEVSGNFCNALHAS